MESQDMMVKQQMEELQKQQRKKQKFMQAVFSLKSLIQEKGPSVSAPLRKSAVLLLSDPSQKQHLNGCIAQTREHLHLQDNASQASQPEQSATNGGYLFEGHLTVDPEPPQPQWLVQSNLLTTAATLFSAESPQGLAGNYTSTENAANVLEELINRLEDVVPLDEHNSCPICRYELQTDDHAYESSKEREKEAEEERKGAENAIRGGEYMYV